MLPSRLAGLALSLVAGAAVMGVVSEVGKPDVQLSIKPEQQAIALIADLPRAQRDRRYVSAEALALEARARAIKPCSTVLAGAQPAVAQAGNFLKGMFGIGDIGGANGRGGGGDHGRGLALDFMTSSNSTGTALANFVLANRDRLGVTYVIWQQRYNDGNGWSMMENRGSPTANHMDHVHVSFRAGAKPPAVNC
ncbi:hypothetical protein [Mycobacteroides saopaulense]|uniref:ARB-07466-like C-terminal domain-containing protein n=1 Tax=Mycobacteroides saopaulense TaxID=1578165 RepID=A0ABX3C0N8_9MYCO|nr:hypothetical protein [Mycobacteroides saopaulense]OHT83369.1 hypothetical protein BKG68_16930 [Mycobacteroides saopaulense]OHU10070.1 hypothetical protein BKG73_11595 [Mycobacteroides saopaulense]